MGMQTACTSHASTEECWLVRALLLAQWESHAASGGMAWRASLRPTVNRLPGGGGGYDDAVDVDAPLDVDEPIDVDDGPGTGSSAA